MTAQNLLGSKTAEKVRVHAAKKAGRAAWEDEQLTEGHNPHAPGTSEALAWIESYREARADSQVKEGKKTR